MGSRGQSSRKRGNKRGGGTQPKVEAEGIKGEAKKEARTPEWYEQHVSFMGEWVEKPKTLSGWVEMGKVHELFSNKETKEFFGEAYEYEATKSAEEIKEILKGMNDMEVDVSRMKNPQKMVEKILEATRTHNLEKAKKDHNWAINILGSTEFKTGLGSGSALDGKDLTEFLGMTRNLYRDKAAAKAWHREWSKVLHPDNNPGNPKAEKAMRRLTELYKIMVEP